MDPLTNGCRTSGPEYYWALGLVDPRTTGRRTKNPSTTGMYPSEELPEAYEGQIEGSEG